MESKLREPQRYYQNQADLNLKKLDTAKRNMRSISIARLLIFIVTVVGIYLAVAYGNKVLAMALSSGFIVFIYLIRIHLQLERKKSWYDALYNINLEEIRILEGNTKEMDSGEEFLDPAHPYNEDLDVFGEKSLFQLINRNATSAGKTKLANTLNNLITDKVTILSRQRAISEILDKIEWRHKFQATGKLFKEKADDQSGLIAWSKSSQTKFNTFFYKAMIIINPIVGFGVITLIELDILTYGAFFLFLLLPMFLVGTKLGILNRIHVDVSKKSGLLLKYAELFKIISGEDFESERLSEIKSKIIGNTSAHQSIKLLAKITKSMDYRLNMLVGFFLNIFFLWDIRQAIRIENWKSKYARYMDEWFQQLSEMDELQSFAGFAYNNTNATFPQITDGDFQLDALNVKHPFISADNSIGNPINIIGWKQFQIITGANMAGKSTYLRTVGVNMILASSGSVVLADKFTYKPVQIFTGIKTKDSLQDGESYFFAELKRLRDIIDSLEKGQKLFIILDEVLRGTNSADKQKGSMALITQLINLSASGILATHDLALGDLKKDFPNNIQNRRFEVEISNNDLSFDYKLKDGISQNLNATFLMKKMGITL